MNILRCLVFVFCILRLTANGVMAQDAASAISRMTNTINASTEEFTLQDSYYIGRAVAAHILSRYAPYNGSPALTSYLNKVCGALTVNSAMPEWYNGYHVMILDSSVPNAFSTPGGHIFITRGIINLASSEDMIAAVIAHELAHIQLRHGLTEIEHERLVQDLTGLQQELAQIAAKNMSSGELIRQFQQPVHDIVTTLFANGYSQPQELEADTLALRLLVQAGYDPTSLRDLLRILARRANGQDNDFMGSHPGPARRIADVEKQMVPYRLPETRRFRTARFTRAITGLPKN